MENFDNRCIVPYKFQIILLISIKILIKLQKIQNMVNILFKQK